MTREEYIYFPTSWSYYPYLIWWDIIMCLHHCSQRIALLLAVSCEVRCPNASSPFFGWCIQSDVTSWDFAVPHMTCFDLFIRDTSGVREFKHVMHVYQCQWKCTRTAARFFFVLSLKHEQILDIGHWHLTYANSSIRTYMVISLIYKATTSMKTINGILRKSLLPIERTNVAKVFARPGSKRRHRLTSLFYFQFAWRACIVFRRNRTLFRYKSILNGFPSYSH